MKRIIFIILIIISRIGHCQYLCDDLGKYQTSIKYAEVFLEGVRDKVKDGIQSISIYDTFQVVDMCNIQSVYLLVLKQKADTNKYYVVISLLEKENLTKSMEIIEVNKYYVLNIKPYFPVNYSLSDFYYPVIIGNKKKMAIEIRLSFGNVYTSPQINGIYYCTQN